MLNIKKYKVPNQTSPENQIIWIINKLERDKKELLEACKEMLDWIDEEGLPELYKKAEQAISKAEGK